MKTISHGSRCFTQPLIPGFHSAKRHLSLNHPLPHHLLSRLVPILSTVPATTPSPGPAPYVLRYVTTTSTPPGPIPFCGSQNGSSYTETFQVFKAMTFILKVLFIHLLLSIRFLKASQIEVCVYIHIFC